MDSMPDVKDLPSMFGEAGMVQGYQNAYNQYDMAKMFQNQRYADNEQKSVQEAQMNPLLLQQRRAQNSADEARLPGIVAASSKATRDNANEGMLNDEHIKTLKSKYTAEQLSDKAKSLASMGDYMRSMSSFALANPLGAAGMIKTQLDDAGGGALWNPSWNQLSPEGLSQVLDSHGKKIQDSASKFNLATAIQDSKNTSAEARGEAANESREAIAETRANAILKRMIAANAGGKNQSLEQLAAKLLEAAQNAEDMGDTATAQKLYERATAAKNGKMDISSASKTAGTPGQIDTPALAQLPAVPVREPTAFGAKPKLGTAENPIILK